MLKNTCITCERANRNLPTYLISSTSAISKLISSIRIYKIVPNIFLIEIYAIESAGKSINDFPSRT